MNRMNFNFVPADDDDLNDDETPTLNSRKSKQQSKCLVYGLVTTTLVSIVLAIALAYLLWKRGDVRSADCHLQGLKATIKGVLRFQSTSDGTRLTGQVRGLTPLQEHAVHIHRYGDESIDSFPFSIGPIFNPHGEVHGCLDSAKRQVGDLGNVLADEDGVGSFDYVDPLLQLNGEASIVGRSLVIRERKDDCVTEPDGDSGDIIAHCDIEITSPEIYAIRV